MAKFNVGDRVRCDDNRGSRKHYKVGEIYTVRAVEGDLVYCEGRNSGMFDYRFSLVTAPLKVGDKVRFKDDYRGDAAGKEAVVIQVPPASWGIQVKQSLNDSVSTESPSSLELVEDNWDFDPRKPHQLKIEAGKFYKTRDGRKVGPMKPFCDVTLFIVKPGDGNVWATDGKAGKWNKDNADLIAEWTSSCAAAQVDNLRDEYGPFTKAEPAAGNDNGKPLTLSDILASALRKPKFKVGDFLTKKYWRPEGYKVKKIDAASVYLDDTFGGSCPYEIDDPDLRLAESTAMATTTPAIVCLIKDGQPRPATEPHVHPSRGHAGDEAARLARKYPGKEFGVYELVDTRQVAAKVYDHEMQRLAAEGETIPAIKAIRDLTGMTLKGAKDAVEHWLAAAA